MGTVSVKSTAQDRDEGTFRKEKKESRQERPAEGKTKQTGRGGGQSEKNRMLTAVSPKMLTIHF